MRRSILMLIVFALFAGLTLSQETVTHTVQSGETLFRIALRYGVSMDALVQTNAISNPTRILAGQVLVIPGLETVSSGVEAPNPLVATEPIIHTVQRGEYLAQIARLYNVSAEQIITANALTNPNRIIPGQQLQIWSPDMAIPVTSAPAPLPTQAADILAPVEPTPVPVVEAPAPVAATTIHTVQAGEYLSAIARSYGVSWQAVAEANGILNPNTIYAGMQLTIPSPSASPVGDMGILQSNVPLGGEPGARIGIGREIVVVLSTQMTYAYENGILQRSALVSTGLPATPTVQGDYKVYLKYDSQTMSGPGYYLPGVPFVMYFYQGYGLHGTYWHENFGQPMSHGCVNMRNDDAEWFYNFAPIGTPVHVRWA